MGYWKQDPTNPQLAYNDIDFTPGSGGNFSSVSFMYLSDYETHVTYLIYAQPVRIVYYDIETYEEIAEPTYLSGSVGADYTTEAKTIQGYTVNYVNGDTSGQFAKIIGPNYGTRYKPVSRQVSYFYKKIIESTVNVNYQDDQGNTITASEIYTGVVGTDYTTEQKVIDGYTFESVEGEATGSFTDSPKTVTYIYKKNPIEKAKVIANYTDEQKVVNGYTFKKVEGDPSGSFTANPKTVTYVYSRIPTEKAKVTVNYLDDQGNTLTNAITLTGAIGTDYTTEQKMIDGYTFKEVQGMKNGAFTEKPQVVTYVYVKNTLIPPDSSGKLTVPNTFNHSLVSTRSSAAQAKNLPQTGEKELTILLWSGEFLLGCALLFFALKKRVE